MVIYSLMRLLRGVQRVLDFERSVCFDLLTTVLCYLQLHLINANVARPWYDLACSSCARCSSRRFLLRF